MVVVSLLALAAYPSARLRTAQCGWLQLQGSLLVGAQHHVGANMTNHCPTIEGVCVAAAVVVLSCACAGSVGALLRRLRCQHVQCSLS